MPGPIPAFSIQSTLNPSNLPDKAIVTTPIYYVNDIPHIGHAYTTIVADVMKKNLAMKGVDVFFLTGTDEHGQKIERAAKLASMDPQSFTDKVSARFRSLFDELSLDYDHFIRTTDASHVQSVQAAFVKMLDKGDIYKGSYEGLYCVSCENYVTRKDAIEEGAKSAVAGGSSMGEEHSKSEEGLKSKSDSTVPSKTHSTPKDLGQGSDSLASTGDLDQKADGILCCPDCGKPLVELSEEAYFFALSRYEDKVLEFARSGAITPEFRANEVISFIENNPLEDLCITRSSFTWGIKAPNVEDRHVIYVWLDALINYISALGYCNDEEPRMEYFDAAYHIVGKDILRFHAIYWPAFLLSLGLPLPVRLAVHGWWTIDGVKMSKSIGNVVDPVKLIGWFDPEGFRFYLLNNIVFGRDGDFSNKSLALSYNAYLCNDLGNLLSRYIGMLSKYYAAQLSELGQVRLAVDKDRLPPALLAKEAELDLLFDGIVPLENFAFKESIESIFACVVFANTLISDTTPWQLAKEERQNELDFIMGLLFDTLVRVGIELYPVIPKASVQILSSFGIQASASLAPEYRRFVINKEKPDDFEVLDLGHLFTKVDIDKEEEGTKNSGKANKEGKESKANKEGKEPAPSHAQEEKSTIAPFSNFSSLDIRVGKILEAYAVPKSSKLICMQIDVGYKTIQVLSGIAKRYAPEELIGASVAVVVNFKPAKLMGLESEGMMLSSEGSSGIKSLEVVRTQGMPGDRIS